MIMVLMPMSSSLSPISGASLPHIVVWTVQATSGSLNFFFFFRILNTFFVALFAFLTNTTEVHMEYVPCPHTFSYGFRRSFWNFTGVIRMVKKYACFFFFFFFFRILKRTRFLIGCSTSLDLYEFRILNGPINKLYLFVRMWSYWLIT